MVRPYLAPLLLGTLCMLAATVFGLIVPRLTGVGVDAAVLEASANRINHIAIYATCLLVAVVVLNYFQALLLGATNARMLCDLRQRVFDHLLGLSADFYESRRIGELLSRIGTDLTIMQGALTGAIPAGVQALIQFVGGVIILLILQTKLTLLALLVIPPVAIGSVLFGKLIRKLATKEQDALADTAAIAEEALNGIRAVQSFSREPHESRRYGSRLGSLKDLQIQTVRIGRRFAAILSLGGFLGFVVVLWYGGNLMVKRQLSPGDLTSFLLYAFVVATSLSTLGRLYAGYQALVGASVRIFELLDARPSVSDPADAARLVRPKGHIVFDSVSFDYPSAKDRMTLRNIHFEVNPGEVIALIGPSGAGKSTVFSLLNRFYDPNSGSITIDGVDLKALNLKDLRESIGIVPQEIFLFTGTIAENIRYGKPDASDEEVRAAAIAAGADEFVQRLGRRYEETVGHRGIKLSGGQRQRIAIARAFLKDPAILLLDEATNSLDPDSEEIVRKALSQLLRGRTTLVIAHRLATARRANRILVLEQGRIIGSGAHDELYASNETYRRYLSLQTTGPGIATDSEQDDVTMTGTCNDL